MGRGRLLSSERYGIAIDLGTTTIAAALVRLSDGMILAKGGSLNPQRVHGLDVIARLQYAGLSAENLSEMQSVVNEELSRVAENLIIEAGIDIQSVEQVVVAGNPTMSHLLLGLPTESLAHPPYRPRNTGAHSLNTRELGWGRGFPLYVFPSPGGFVGGDTIAFLFGSGFPEPKTRSPAVPRKSAPALYLDLGTNGEIALNANGKIFATSAAAGPAFEGGNLGCGMAALPGAIYSVELCDGKLVTACVNNAPPKGLCGSGVLDLVSLLLSEGLLDSTGRLLDPSESSSPLGNCLKEIGGERHFVLYRDAKSLLSLSQEDIRQVQLAKGAVRAAMEVLFQRAEVAAHDLKKVVITGSFGASISFESLKSVGVLTQNMVKNASFIREGALAGAIRALMEPDSEKQIESLAAELKIIPLSGTPLFERHFMEHIGFQ